mgnify:CR=1 FL=1
MPTRVSSGANDPRPQMTRRTGKRTTATAVSLGEDWRSSTLLISDTLSCYRVDLETWLRVTMLRFDRNNTNNKSYGRSLPYEVPVELLANSSQSVFAGALTFRRGCSVMRSCQRGCVIFPDPHIYDSVKCTTSHFSDYRPIQKYPSPNFYFFLTNSPSMMILRDYILTQGKLLVDIQVLFRR